ncbi:hypothetical protein D9V37_10080 [Nocardioides mangrovicus]|uniref:Uncharacterized protein n=1 Tax=Nocardioides mangrovicus TaxID=2478913 RepID=A0A3L8P275_9ACTN|nr:hypothetical protein [Nocardioides mangrovicus]RLV48933.1 hypothetical protein D9V37_10080 [Nocardioides mangrovicus]
MSDYIDLATVGKVIGFAIVAGAGLPLVFALGLRSLSVGTAEGDEQSFQVTKNPAALVGAVVCFLLVAAAIVYAVYLITHKS